MKEKLIVTFLLLSFLGNAQEKKTTYSFTLQQAIEHAVENNYSAINANRDIEIAKQKNGKQPLLVFLKLRVIYNT